MQIIQLKNSHPQPSTSVCKEGNGWANKFWSCSGGIVCEKSFNFVQWSFHVQKVMNICCQSEDAAQNLPFCCGGSHIFSCTLTFVSLSCTNIIVLFRFQIEKKPIITDYRLFDSIIDCWKSCTYVSFRFYTWT